MLRHFITINDFSKVEIIDMLETIRMIKAADKQGCSPKLLEGASLAMIFEEPSTRTRVSFEVAMTELGGHALYLKPGEIHLGIRESLSDTAKVLSRMCDIVMIRALKHSTVTDFARDSSVPVINGLTDFNHPTQGLCDIFTMTEHFPIGKKMEDLNVTFVGDATNVLSSIMFICTRLGMNFTHAAPKKYQNPEWYRIAEANCKLSGGSLQVTEDPFEAVVHADFIYTDLWWWVDQEDQIPERRAAFMPNYQVNMEMLKNAPTHCKVMHCLPASRGVEATNEVLDSVQSIIFDQAENRLHTEKGILTWFLYPLLKRPSKELRNLHKGKIESFLEEKLF